MILLLSDDLLDASKTIADADAHEVDQRAHPTDPRRRNDRAARSGVAASDTYPIVANT